MGMTKPDLKGLLARLTDAEKARICLVFFMYMIQDHLVAIAQGREAMPVGGVASIRDLDPGLEGRLDRAVATGDSKALNEGMKDVFRGLPGLQKDRSGGRFNAFFRAHLEPEVFATLYRAAGLDPEAVVIDPGFPTDWPDRGAAG
jgi:hypothetical protein